MIRKVILAGVAALGLAAAANAQPMNMGGGDGMTTDFITKAAQSDEFERREGKLAETHAHNPHVKHFASMMVSAHTKTTKDLKKAIRMSGMTPPPPPALTDDQMQMIASLKSTHGRDFDKTYIDQQVQAHQMTLDTMKSYAQAGHPGPIKDAAVNTAPLVQSHLDMAKDIQSHIDG
jgi:putative membrane protein